MTQTKINRALTLCPQIHDGRRTVNEIVDRIEANSNAAVLAKMTSTQIAVVFSAANASYHAGRAAAE